MSFTKPVLPLGMFILGLVLLSSAVTAQPGRTDCAEFSGQSRCSSALFVPDREARIPNIPLDGDGFSYQYCDGSIPSAASRRRDCAVFRGGDWVNDDCANAAPFPVGENGWLSQVPSAILFNQSQLPGSICDAKLTSVSWLPENDTTRVGACNTRPPEVRQGYELWGRAVLNIAIKRLDANRACVVPDTLTQQLTRERRLTISCPAGSTPLNTSGRPTTSDTARLCQWDEARSCGKGNPVQPENGCKIQHELDYHGPSGLKLSRFYDSAGFAFRPVADNLGGVGYMPLGNHWRHSYDLKLVSLTPARPGDASAVLILANGKLRYFDDTGLEKMRAGRPRARLKTTDDANGAVIARIIHETSGDELHFSANGELLEKRTAAGLRTSLSYQTLPGVQPPTRALATVTGHFGHRLSFEYATNGKLIRVLDPAGRTIVYDMGNARLNSVTYQDGGKRSYVYSETDRPWLLTDIVADDGANYAHFEYDSAGRAVTTGHGYDGVAYLSDSLALRYVDDDTAETFDSLGTRQTLEFERRNGSINIVSEIYDDGLGVLREYDERNRLISRTERNHDGDRITTYSYNATDQRIQRTEAAGTAYARTTRWEYLSPQIDLVTRMVEPGVNPAEPAVTVHRYDNALNRISTSRIGVASDGSRRSRTTRFEYDSSGRLISIDGPRSDVRDITRHSYYTCTSGGACGQLRSTTNALGHVIRYEKYDDHGRPVRIVDANGNTELLRYDVRGRLVRSTRIAKR